MNTDSELLRRYLEERSEAAFTALVRRHLALVYSVALRRVGGDTHLAEDVAQKVFADLARKASSLTERPTLAGWLYASAHLASAATVRAEQRRKARETEAHLMQATFSTPGSDADEAQLRSVLDDLIVTLKDDEREAIALRFLEKRSFADVGAALRVTEEAARKRVDRVLEKLRTALARRGITSTAAALGLTLAGIGTASISGDAAAKIAAHAFAQSTAATGTTIAGIVGKTLLPAAALLVVGGLLINAQRHANQSLRAELAQLTNENRELAAVVNTSAPRPAPRLAQSAITPQPAPVSPTDATPAPVPSRPINARINITTDGAIVWNREPVTLEEFIARLQKLQTSGDPEGRLNIRGAGVRFSALNFVIDEVRKAQVNHLTVESDATPDPKSSGAWF